MKELKESRFIVLNAGCAEHYADWNWENVQSPFARIYLVKEGAATIHLPEKSIRIMPGYIYLIPPFTLHRYECESHLILYYFHIYESLTCEIRVLEEYNFPVAMEAGEFEKILIIRLLEINPDKELLKYDPSSYDNNPTLIRHLTRNSKISLSTSLENNGILYQLLSRFVARSSKKYAFTDNRIRGVVHYIRKNVDQEITLDNLAKRCYLSKDHFICSFKKEMGMTPGRYIHLQKIERAQLLLISTTMQIKAIAQTLSFYNLSSFNRLFKQITGTTPKIYRNRMGETN
ncbi:MAG: AraC family transcriptional regulator [Bacteroides sp.]|nr:AraC family transcriptional regulator [Bacteroides sp.]